MLMYLSKRKEGGGTAHSMLFRSLPLVDESLVPPTEDTVNFDLQHSHQLKFTLTSAHFKMHILFHMGRAKRKGTL